MSQTARTRASALLGLFLSAAWWGSLGGYLFVLVLVLAGDPAATSAAVVLRSGGLTFTALPTLTPAWLRTAEHLVGFPCAAVSLYVIYQVRALHRHVQLARPFAPDAHRRIQSIGWCLLVRGITVSALEVARGFSLYPRLPGVGFDLLRAFDWQGLALGLIAFALAAVFRHGTALHEEAELTV